MAKFYGKIGYSHTVETTPGVWTEDIIEKDHYGDIIKNVRKWESTENVNKNLVLNNRVSIVTDSFSINNTQNMKYIILLGSKWEIKSVEIDNPRLILSIGGVYNV